MFWARKPNSSRAGNLKEAHVNGRRYIVCHNREQGKKRALIAKESCAGYTVCHALTC